MAFILHKKDGQNVVALQLIAKAVLDLSKSQAASLIFIIIVANFWCNVFCLEYKCFLRPFLVRGLDRSLNPGGLEVLACPFKYFSVLFNIPILKFRNL